MNYSVRWSFFGLFLFLCGSFLFVSLCIFLGFHSRHIVQSFNHSMIQSLIFQSFVQLWHFFFSFFFTLWLCYPVLHWSSRWFEFRGTSNLWLCILLGTHQLYLCQRCGIYNVCFDCCCYRCDDCCSFQYVVAENDIEPSCNSMLLDMRKKYILWNSEYSPLSGGGEATHTHTHILK